MLEKVRSINNFLSSHMFYITIFAISLGYILPFTTPNPYAKTVNIMLFALVTFFASISLSIKDFLSILKNPRIPLWLLFVVHVCGPIVIYLLSLLFYPDDAQTRMGLLMAAILPMGVSTIVWISVMGGNIGVSVVAITLDTLLAPFIVAIFLKLFFQQSIEINYATMLLEMMCMVTIPSILGMVAHNYLSKTPSLYTKITVFGALFSKFCMAAVIYISVATVFPNIVFDHSIIKLVLVAMVLVLSAFVLGYVASLPVKNLDRGLFISIIYNVGMRNINFGIVLAVGYFPPAIAIPVTLMTLFQQPTAALVCYCINRIYSLRQK